MKLLQKRWGSRLGGRRKEFNSFLLCMRKSGDGMNMGQISSASDSVLDRMRDGKESKAIIKKFMH